MAVRPKKHRDMGCEWHYSRMKEDNVPIMINKNIILEPQSCVKLLGVQIDNRLTFHDRISSLCKKAGQKLHDCQRIYKQM